MPQLDYHRPDPEESRREQLRKMENWIGLIAIAILVLSCLLCGVLGTFFHPPDL
ncbi:MAG TPA: hypothetical protein VLJ39_08230 [Tepidisphaeraceae bacterium]|jgi:hypothetical protein|nr:hypothetical protein [Tepidisphaeraceae bacterium]